MIAPTSIGLRPPTVIRELVSALQESPVSSSRTLIRWGLLPVLPTQRERVYLIGVTDYLLAPVTRSHHVRDENFGIRGLLEVQELGDNSLEAASTRAWELLTELDSTLYTEQSLASGARYAGILAVSGDEVVPVADGWLARIIFTLAFESRR